jgi:hypothetical protein
MNVLKHLFYGATVVVFIVTSFALDVRAFYGWVTLNESAWQMLVYFGAALGFMASATHAIEKGQKLLEEEQEEEEEKKP